MNFGARGNYEESPRTPTRYAESESALDHSDTDLEIDLSATLTPRKASSPIPCLKSEHEQDIIKIIEDEIGKHLSEKAEKSNLTVTNVKSIIKQVLTNEHFRAFLGKDENESKVRLPSYEPKLTRSKAKELLSSNSIQVPAVNIPWVPQPPPSETHVLIGEDLKEDDSGDEYVPGEEESEDDKDESIASESDIGSLPPPTPPTPVPMEDHATQTTNYTDDGVFKIPPPKTAQEEAAEEAANIALRTRSKINLSSTPLEVIEKSFIPPDITTDMYDMECDDEEWREFLKGFTEPLEEVIKPTEDDEQDPEYNILADDEINNIDNEDFRMDKAVKITKKEIKELWEELFEYLREVSEEYDEKNKDQVQQSSVNDVFENLAQNINSCETTNQFNNIEGSNEPSSPKKSKPDIPKLLNITIDYQQLSILEQQMRQHVQILTQNFLLTFEHPEFHNYSTQLKEYLLNLKFLSEGKTYSLFRPVNLTPAIKLIDDWVDLCASNCDSINKCKEHIQQELFKSIQYKMAGNWQFIVTFPKLILEVITKSDVFLYPSLLPKIPLKSEQFSGGRTGFTDAEDSLLAFGMDQFKTFLSDEKKGKNVSLKDVVFHVQEYMMPHRNKQTILKHVTQSKHPRCATNPIQQYVLHGKLKPVLHYVYPLNQIIPPCRRRPEELPLQWKYFIYPELKSGSNLSQNYLNAPPVQNIVPQQIILINSPFSGIPLYTSPIILSNTSQVKYHSRRAKRSKISLEKKFNTVKKVDCSFKSYECVKQTLNRKKCRSRTSSGSHENNILDSSFTSIELVVTIFTRPVALQKLTRFLTHIDQKRKNQTVTSEQVNKFMFPKMSTINVPINFVDSKRKEASEECPVISTTAEKTDSTETPLEDTKCSSSEHKKPETVTSCTINQDKRNFKNLGFSTITSGSFQKANSSSEVEFCRNSNNIQICQTSQYDNRDTPSSSGYNSGSTVSGKDNPEDINALLIASATVKPETKPNVRKELSGAEKKKNKLRKEFLANLAIATPEDPENEKHKSEMFAIAYYDKLRQTLEIEDYNKLMQVLKDFGSGDVIDLYNDVQDILRPKYTELAEEFLFFLKEKEANAVGQLIPWLEIQARTKFLRKLEVFLKDQPAQLKKIYNTLMDLTMSKNLSMEKIKSVLLPLLKGNVILLDLFLQNFRDERPPPSLLEGPYETIDINKELARPDNEELYETFVVPNTEDKYGGQNCICHCHRIEDNEYKTRYKHCNACGLKFANGRLYLSAGRVFQPATVMFKTSPHVNHNVRLLGKSATTTSSSHKKKRSDTSPNKLANCSGKDNLEEDTEDEEMGKRKRSISQRNPRKQITLEETSQDNYKSEDSTSSMEAQSDSNINVEPPWKREEDTIILETLQKEDDKEYALQIISDKLPNRTVGQIRSRLSRLMDLLIESLKNT